MRLEWGGSSFISVSIFWFVRLTVSPMKKSQVLRSGDLDFLVCFRFLAVSLGDMEGAVGIRLRRRVGDARPPTP